MMPKLILKHLQPALLQHYWSPNTVHSTLFDLGVVLEAEIRIFHPSQHFRTSRPLHHLLGLCTHNRSFPICHHSTTILLRPHIPNFKLLCSTYRHQLQPNPSSAILLRKKLTPPKNWSNTSFGWVLGLQYKPLHFSVRKKH